MSASGRTIFVVAKRGAEWQIAHSAMNEAAN